MAEGCILRKMRKPTKKEHSALVGSCEVNDFFGFSATVYAAGMGFLLLEGPDADGCACRLFDFSFTFGASTPSGLDEAAFALAYLLKLFIVCDESGFLG